MLNLNRRTVWGILFVFASLMLIFAFVLEYSFNLPPCSLCLLARAALGGFIISSGLYWLINPNTMFWHVFWGGFSGLFAGLGAYITGHHAWILSLPIEKRPDCGPPIEYLLESLPIIDAIKAMFTSTGDCAKQSNLFLGINLPTWSLIGFLILLAGCLVGFWQKKRA